MSTMAEGSRKFLISLVVLGIICSNVYAEVVQKTDIDVSRLFTDGKGNNTGCGCVGYNCGCCATLTLQQIGLNDTVCTNMTYLPDQYGVSLTVSVDGKVYINETVSAKNPPPICFEVPYLKKYASLCVRFYDLDVQDHKFSGCVRIEARLAGLVIEDYNLGCFKIPPKQTLINEGRHERRVMSLGDTSTGCSCLFYDCGCCVDVSRSSSWLLAAVDTACANLTFLPKTSEVMVALTFDKEVIYKKVIPVRNPPPVCFNMPFVPKIQGCIQLYKLDIKDAQLSGCVKLLAEMEDKVMETLDLGCFKFPKPGTEGAQMITKGPASEPLKHVKNNPDFHKLLFLAYNEAKKEKMLKGIYN